MWALVIRTSIVLGNHPVSVKLQRIFLLRLREGVTKKKVEKDLNLTVSQTEDQSSRICSLCSNKVRSTWAECSIIKTSFQ